MPIAGHGCDHRSPFATAPPPNWMTEGCDPDRRQRNGDVLACPAHRLIVHTRSGRAHAPGRFRGWLGPPSGAVVRGGDRPAKTPPSFARAPDPRLIGARAPAVIRSAWRPTPTTSTRRLGQLVRRGHEHARSRPSRSRQERSVIAHCEQQRPHSTVLDEAWPDSDCWNSRIRHCDRRR